MHDIISWNSLLDSFFQWLKVGISTFFVAYIFPNYNYFVAIMIMATINIVFGAWADKYWSFSKAFRAIRYLIMYLTVLLLIILISVLQRVDIPNRELAVSWITWVMIYFYTVNILRNWNYKQPDNRVISFLYFVFSFKIIDKISYMRDFSEYEKNGDMKDHESNEDHNSNNSNTEKNDQQNTIEEPN